MTRSRLPQEICRQLGWKNAAGKPKEMNCRICTPYLARQGQYVLPEGLVIDFARKSFSGVPEVGPGSEAELVSTPLSELGPAGQRVQQGRGVPVKKVLVYSLEK
ncbi:MAG: hypothetical protein ACYCTV_04275 [Leptospirales bacterium]